MRYGQEIANRNILPAGTENNPPLPPLSLINHSPTQLDFFLKKIITSSSAQTVYKLPNMAQPTIKLSSGHEMPQVGFGLWKVDKETCADTVYNAIKTGYRLLDGACGAFLQSRQTGR